MIKLEHVSMKFNLGIEKNFSVKQAFVDFFSFKKKKKKKKDEFWALRDISFEVKKGEVIGLIGSNGAGKSTLLKIVSGVMKPTNGKVKVSGVISPMIELGAGFDMELTARENIFLNGAILGYSKQFLESKFDEIVEFLPKINLLLIMSVEPGKGGQKFIESTTQKIKKAKTKIDELNLETEIEVDGGVNLENSKEIREAGATMLVSGTAIISSKDYNYTIRKMKE